MDVIDFAIDNNLCDMTIPISYQQKLIGSYVMYNTDDGIFLYTYTSGYEQPHRLSYEIGHGDTLIVKNKILYGIFRNNLIIKVCLDNCIIKENNDPKIIMKNTLVLNRI